MAGPKASPREGRLDLLVRDVRREAFGIVSIDLARPSGAPLPAFTAGAHIDVHLHGGIVRQYSLCGAPANRDKYQIAVLLEKNGRGGSAAVHRLRPGDVVSTSAPRNNFPLATDGVVRHVFVAGGIGVTPMMAMVADLEFRGEPYYLHYCTRSPAHTAFLDRLRPLVRASKATLHHDGGVPAQGLDLSAMFREPEHGVHVYVCGPEGFMEAARRATRSWPSRQVHFEHFTAPEQSPKDSDWDSVPFRIELLKSERTLDVPANCSIVKALRNAGIEVDTSCEDGYCGACITRYLGGTPVHRDNVLGEDDRKKFILVCRARSQTPVLVLDL